MRVMSRPAISMANAMPMPRVPSSRPASMIGIAHDALQEGRHQRHRGDQQHAAHEHEDEADDEVAVAEDLDGDERLRASSASAR